MTIDSEDNEYLECPDGVSDLGRAAHSAVMRVLQRNELTYTGGCKAFYSSDEWKARGESYGIGAELIVVYDGGDLTRVFNMDYLEHDLMDQLTDELAAVGLFCEACTGWYSAIYKI